MGLDFSLTRVQSTEVFTANITHNLCAMAEEAGIYKALWRPEEIGITKAYQMIPILKEGLKLLKSYPKRFKKFNADNGWGTYKHFIPWVEEILAACVEYPDADVQAIR